MGGVDDVEPKLLFRSYDRYISVVRCAFDCPLKFGKLSVAQALTVTVPNTSLLIKTQGSEFFQICNFLHVPLRMDKRLIRYTFNATL